MYLVNLMNWLEVMIILLFVMMTLTAVMARADDYGVVVYGGTPGGVVAAVA